MTLQGLLAIGQLEKHDASPVEVLRMLAAAERSIVDARNQLFLRMPAFPRWAIIESFESEGWPATA